MCGRLRGLAYGLLQEERNDDQPHRHVGKAEAARRRAVPQVHRRATFERRQSKAPADDDHELSVLDDLLPLTADTRRIAEAADPDNSGEVYSPPAHPPTKNTTIAASQQINIRVRFAEESRNALHAWHRQQSQLDVRINAPQRNDPLAGARVRS